MEVETGGNEADFRLLGSDDALFAAAAGRFVRWTNPGLAATNASSAFDEEHPSPFPLYTTLERSDFDVKFDVKLHMCAGCSTSIADRTLLAVGGLCYHSSCLTCSLCRTPLDGCTSCFLRHNSVYCKGCYNQEFGTKCASCGRAITADDWVRRARRHVYHIACFACEQCKRQLSTGEEFALQDNRLLCKQHYIELVEGDTGHSKAKTKRVRTTFAEEQLSVLQSHFQIDSNPDGADLERIANMTGLSKRVTQVWFQNSRARQKKYQGNKKSRNAQSENGGGPSGSEDASSPKSPGSSSDGMIFPTSVTTSAEDAIVSTSSLSIAMQSIYP